MASRDEDSGHHLVMATSSEPSEGHMETSNEVSEFRVATSGESSEGHMAASGEQSESHIDMLALRGDLPVPDIDISSSDEEHEGHLVPAGSAEHREVLELESQAITLSTGEQRSGNAQAANMINIVTGGAGQGTLGRGEC
ncbi:uncharacterized protein LOC124255141 isoform X3 [Haliotis rubra]|uniref:uncharacterized protein LOC124255141 isoform X2 n=1 Tax=Haliotis rubra TaxID=36100 RepID=UPI001EE501C8|nr:uncharacterized protein LOC124255141 isoform X2 [Haliotis rubra]XP_046544939.1 uncharacterized protein LOC124255141 isoform X3 [Haliotis rubra]